jgi:hypothetical protein
LRLPKSFFRQILMVKILLKIIYLTVLDTIIGSLALRSTY